MQRLRQCAFAVLAALALAGSVMAQGSIGSYPRTNNRPTVSPYLNLTRGGNVAVNYYGLTRPQQDTNRTLQTIQQQLQHLPLGPQGFLMGPTEVEQPPLTLTTGFRPSFGNTSHYFGAPGSHGVLGGGDGPASTGIRR